MADYREISQQYAQGGLRALAVANGGAAIAVLSQLGQLQQLDLAASTGNALIAWVVGISLALTCWLISFLSTRHVDRSEEPSRDNEKERKISNYFMYFGMILFLGSLACFAYGCISLSIAFIETSTPVPG